jgi:hypothetical protein
MEVRAVKGHEEAEEYGKREGASVAHAGQAAVKGAEGFNGRGDVV